MNKASVGYSVIVEIAYIHILYSIGFISSRYISFLS